MRETTDAVQEHGSELAGLAGKHLTFRLGEEEYGLEIMKVQEIMGILPVTKIPRVPAYVRGVINLRGKIIPTIELRSKFGLDHQEDTEKTCIIVVELHTPKGMVDMGIIVDEVAEVMDFSEENIDPPPQFGTNLDTAFIQGVGVVNGRVTILLDIDGLLTAEEITTVEDVANN